MDGLVSVHQMNANSQNRCNILAARCTKPHLDERVQFVVTDEINKQRSFYLLCCPSHQNKNLGKGRHLCRGQL